MSFCRHTLFDDGGDDGSAGCGEGDEAISAAKNVPELPSWVWLLAVRARGCLLADCGAPLGPSIVYTQRMTARDAARLHGQTTCYRYITGGDL